MIRFSSAAFPIFAKSRTSCVYYISVARILYIRLTFTVEKPIAIWSKNCGKLPGRTEPKLPDIGHSYSTVNGPNDVRSVPRLRQHLALLKLYFIIT